MFSTAEKIETIGETRTSGLFGSYTATSDNSAVIVLGNRFSEGRAFNVRMTAVGFEVREHKSDFVGCAETVLDAAHLVLNP